MKLIPLTQGQFAQVDDADYDSLVRHKWYTRKTKNISYAVMSEMINNKEDKMLMHRKIMNCHNGDGKIVDHIDGNGLNNQRSNLRFATISQNTANRRSWGASKYLGVTTKKVTGKKYWIAKSGKDGKKYSSKCFPFTQEGEILAAKAYDAKAKELHGIYAKLNFPNL